VNLGKTPRKTQYRSDGAFKILKFRDVGVSTVDWNNSQSGLVDPSATSALREVVPGDILLTASAHSSEHIGRKAALIQAVPSHFSRAFFVGELLNIRCHGGRPQSDLLLRFLQSDDGYRQVQKHVRGGHLIASEARKMRVPVIEGSDAATISSAIDSYFTRLDDVTATLEQVERKLARYRASVLKAAVEGKLVPNEAELARQEGRDYEPAPQLLGRILVERRKRWENQAWEKEVVKAKKKAAKARRKAAGNPFKRGEKLPTEEWLDLDEDQCTPHLPAGEKWKGRYKEPAPPDPDDQESLPEGWAWACIEQLTLVGTGATPKRGNPRYWSDGTVPWVTSAVVNDHFVDEPSEHVTRLALAETNLTMYPPGTLLVAMYGEGRTRGRSAVTRIATTTNQALAALLTTPLPDITTEWLRTFMDHNYATIRRASAGGVQPNLNKGIVERTRLPLPPEAEQARIVEEVERMLSVQRAQATALRASVRRARRLRQAILGWAFEGRLVDQDPNDEPADQLLERIRQAKETGT